MPSIKSAGEAHWKKALSGELRSVDVPEWGGTIYFRDRYTGEDRITLSDVRDEEGVLAYCYEVVLRKACAEDGSRLWADSERLKLRRHYDPDVVERIGLHIASTINQPEEIGDAEKNSEAAES